MGAFEGVDLDGIGGFEAVDQGLIRTVVATFVFEDLVGFGFVHRHLGIAGLRFLVDWMFFDSLDDLKETMDAEGSFGLYFPDEVLIRLELLQGDHLFVFVCGHTDLVVC